jgi:uncharacterized membrane protein
MQRRRHVGIATALFFVAIFPGNISQYVNGIDAFGLDTDRARAIRLLFQPLLVLWALWATEFWQPRETTPPATQRDDLEEDTIYG